MADCQRPTQHLVSAARLSRARCDTPWRSHGCSSRTGKRSPMSEISHSPQQWHRPGLRAIGAREASEIPATIDLADGVIDLADGAGREARKPQAR